MPRKPMTMKQWDDKHSDDCPCEGCTMLRHAKMMHCHPMGATEDEPPVLDISEAFRAFVDKGTLAELQAEMVAFSEGRDA